MESLLRNIQYGLMDYIEGEDEPDYTSDDVNKCIKMLIGFYDSVESKANSLSEAKVFIREVILSLNELNEECQHCLIETDQREQICEFIFRVLENADIEFDGDVTEEWRDW